MSCEMVAAPRANELKIDLKRSDSRQVMAVRTTTVARRVRPAAVNASEVDVHGRGMAGHTATVAEHAAEMPDHAQGIVECAVRAIVYRPRATDTRRPVTVHAAGTSDTVTEVSVYSSPVAVRALENAEYAPAMTVHVLEVVVSEQWARALPLRLPASRLRGCRPAIWGSSIGAPAVD